MKFDSSEAFPINGNFIFDDSIKVATGWNLIGTLTVPIALSTIHSEPAELITSDVFGFVPGLGYQQTDIFQPGQGYWVKVSQSGTIILKDVSTIIGDVAIDTTEIGGTNLTLVSSYSESEPSPDDTLSARVSNEGNQLLLVVDGEDNLRALTLSSFQNSHPDILKLDASGTAATMIFMTPGISTTDTSEYYSTLSNITSLPGFNQFRDYLRQKLIVLPLNEIVLDTLYDSLLVTCITQYLELFPNNFHLDKIQNPGEEKNDFELLQENNNRNAQLSMANKSFRFVNVVRRDLNQANTLIGNTVLVEGMGGAIPLSWGSLFTWTSFNPTNASSQFTFPVDVASSELWVVGPGWSASSDVPPTDIQDIDKPWLETITFNLAFPILDLWAGGAHQLAKSSAGVKQFVLALEGANISLNENALANATTLRSRARETINLTTSLLGAGITVGVITGPVAVIGAKILAVGTGILSSANALIFAGTIAFDEPYTKFQLAVPSSSGTSCVGTPTVTYAGKTYNTVQIGTQCWLKENLDVGTMVTGNTNQTDNGTIEKYCYDDDPANCSTYGGLYQWNETMQYSTTAGSQGVCPPGWHIPTYAELQTLKTYMGNDGNALKAIGQGAGGGAGTNTSGFSALLSGGRTTFQFFGLGSRTNLQSSTEYDATGEYNLYLIFNTIDIGLGWSSKDNGYSVRCLKD